MRYCSVPYYTGRGGFYFPNSLLYEQSGLLPFDHNNTNTAVGKSRLATPQSLTAENNACAIRNSAKVYSEVKLS